MRSAVKALEGFPLLAEPGANGADELVRIIDVQRPAAIKTDVVRHIHQGVDGTQTHSLQALLHPQRGGAVAHALEVAAGKARAGVTRFARERKFDFNGTIVGAFHARKLALGAQRSKTRSGEVAGDAAHA